MANELHAALPGASWADNAWVVGPLASDVVRNYDTWLLPSPDYMPLAETKSGNLRVFRGRGRLLYITREDAQARIVLQRKSCSVLGIGFPSPADDTWMQFGISPLDPQLKLESRVRDTALDPCPDGGYWIGSPSKLMWAELFIRSDGHPSSTLQVSAERPETEGWVRRTLGFGQGDYYIREGPDFVEVVWFRDVWYLLRARGLDRLTAMRLPCLTFYPALLC